MIIKTFDPKKQIEVVAGAFDQTTRCFSKEVQPAHYMIKERGYGISEDVVQQLKELGCLAIKVKTKKNKRYVYMFKDILNLEVKDYGHGKQRFMRAL